MFAKTIEKLEDLRDACVPGGDGQEALDAAIELMRRAEPKDEAAEQEHCARAVKLGWFDEKSQVEALRSYANLLMSERAAVRAECQTKLVAAQAENTNLRSIATDNQADMLDARRQLKAAQGEISQHEDVLAETVAQCDQHTRELETKLKAAQAEHARLREAAEVVVQTFNTFDTYRQHEMRALRAALKPRADEFESRMRTTLSFPHGVCEICYELNGECSACAAERKP